MQENHLLPLDDPHDDRKPYQQLPGEPDKWYRCFERYCQMGPTRDLLQLYRQVMQERHTAGSPGEQPPARRVSGAWRQKYREYDWEARARAWDEDRREMAVKHSEEILNRIMKSTLNALQILEDMMNGVIKDANGEVILVVDPYQIRMAAKIVLSKGLEVIPLLMAAQGGERQEIPINNIFAQQPDSWQFPNQVEVNQGQSESEKKI